MTFYCSNAACLVALNALVDRIDAGAGAGTLVIYSGTVPADADTALSGNTVLATLTFSDPAFGNAADAAPGGTATANAITSDTSADATGTATFFRVFDSDALIVFQGTVGTSGADINLNTVSIVSGATVAVTSLTISLPESDA